jgi:hypothetical protein
MASHAVHFDKPAAHQADDLFFEQTNQPYSLSSRSSTTSRGPLGYAYLDSPIQPLMRWTVDIFRKSNIPIEQHVLVPWLFFNEDQPREHVNPSLVFETDD